jgi:hypothetical protein
MRNYQLLKKDSAPWSQSVGLAASKVTYKSYFYVRTEENPGTYEPATPFVSQKISRKVAKITWIKSEQNGK